MAISEPMIDSDKLSDNLQFDFFENLPHYALNYLAVSLAPSVQSLANLSANRRPRFANAESALMSNRSGSQGGFHGPGGMFLFWLVHETQTIIKADRVAKPPDASQSHRCARLTASISHGSGSSCSGRNEQISEVAAWNSQAGFGIPFASS